MLPNRRLAGKELFYRIRIGYYKQTVLIVHIMITAPLLAQSDGLICRIIGTQNPVAVMLYSDRVTHSKILLYRQMVIDVNPFLRADFSGCIVKMPVNSIELTTLCALLCEKICRSKSAV